MIKVLSNNSVVKGMNLLIFLIIIEFILLVSFYLFQHQYALFRYVYIVVSSSIFIAILYFAWSTTIKIKELITNLNRELEDKTKELQLLNTQLEQKVQTEVEKNREKDQIMYQHARLASMGEMVGNIAHQWRQPLSALSMIIQSFSIKSMAGKLDQRFIDSQVSEGLRISKTMSNTIDDFNNFFLPNKSREYFDIEHVLQDTLEFAKENKVDIHIDCQKNFRVYGFQNELSQVVLNLLNNAIDNFKQQDIKIDQHILIQVLKPKNSKKSGQILFIDNGGGIDQHIMDKIFDPYFTTKHKSAGTGIGLYMSKQIIERQMRGELKVCNTTKTFDDQSYKCAQFCIILPIRDEELKESA
jgi:signal transduction histidine kinase